MSVCCFVWAVGFVGGRVKNTTASTTTISETTAVRTKDFFIVSSPLNEISETRFKNQMPIGKTEECKHRGYCWYMVSPIAPTATIEHRNSTCSYVEV